MSLEQDSSDKSNTLCRDCGKFYGCRSFDGLCSACYKSHQQNAKHEERGLSSEKVEPLSPDVQECDYQMEMDESCVQPMKKEVQQDRSRCFGCRKRVGLLGVDCKCGQVFCNVHRLPQTHSCLFDHKGKAVQQLKKTLVALPSGKIIKF